ncbi:MAG: isocitrate/isopropylmalate family dehydrogenase [Dehalococcoidia bacterium]
MSKRVVVLPGDDAAPEAVAPSVDVLKALEPDIAWTYLPTGEEGLARYSQAEFNRVVFDAIDRSDTTLFGAASGKTQGTAHLRWGKGTYANVRPVRWRPGFNSPLKRPEGIDFIIVRENLEDLYVGVEGELGGLAPLQPKRRRDNTPLDLSGNGRFAIKVITEASTRRVTRFACELALRRKDAGHPGKVTVTAKYNVLPVTDGLFMQTAEAVVRDEYPTLTYEQFIVDDFARRIVAAPHALDVVVMPNLYGDILSDEAAGIIGGLGLAPSGCYGDSYAYFESVHGSAPDIAGRHIINPTATLLSAVLMLDYLGMRDLATRLDDAVGRVYAEGKHLTPDQGGAASTEEFCAAVREAL